MSIFQHSKGIERVQDITSLITGLASQFETASEEKQQMYIKGMSLFTEDLQEAIQALNQSTTSNNQTGTNQ